MIRAAEFSDDGKYRYVLSRTWDVYRPFAMCIGLNPSRADSEKDDATIHILVKALDAMGYGGLKMVNLYALISPHPKDLHACADPLKGNDAWVKTTAYHCKDVIFCWGNFKGIEYQAKKWISLFPDALCFGRNANGTPMHPRGLSYIKGYTAEKTKLERYGA